MASREGGLGQDPFHGPDQAIPGRRTDEVVDGSHLESRVGLSLVFGQKNDGRTVSLHMQGIGQIEPVGLALQSFPEKDHVIGNMVQQTLGFAGRGGLAEHFDGSEMLQVLPKSLSDIRILMQEKCFPCAHGCLWVQVTVFLPYIRSVPVKQEWFRYPRKYGLHH